MVAKLTTLLDDPDFIEQQSLLAERRAAAAATPEAIAKKEADAKKTSSIDALTQQILSQKTTDKWTGQGYGGAEANAKAMAKLLADAGITDIKQFGKIDKYEPVEVVGYSLNGKQVQNPSKGVYYESIPEPDGEGGISGYRRRDLTPAEIAQVKPVYQSLTESGSYDQAGDPIYATVDPSTIVERDGKLVGVTGQTFGNKETGQEINRGSGRWERQGGEGLFSGTGEGKGNTAFRVDFTPDGTPVFYTTQGTSNDLALLMQDLGPIGSIAANYLAMQFGGPAGVAALNAAQGKDFKDVAKATLLAYAGGEASKAFSGSGGLLGSNAVSAAGELNAASDLASSMADQGMSLAEINQQLQSVGYNPDAISSALQDASNIISAPPLSSVDFTPALEQPISNAVTTSPIETVQVSAPIAPTPTINNLVGAIAAQQPVAPVETLQVKAQKEPLTPPVTPTISDVLNAIIQAPTPLEVTAPRVTAPTAETPKTVDQVIAAITPELVMTGDRPIIKERPSSITDEPTPLLPIVAPPIDTTLPSNKSPLSVSDTIRLASVASTIAAINAQPSTPANTSTQYPIVDVPAEWTSPINPNAIPSTSVVPSTSLPAIDFGNKEMLRGTQWERFLSPDYGKVPQPIQYSQPSNLSYSDLMDILGSKQGMPSKSSLSINDIISGIQNQYGQTPQGSMG